MSWRIAGSYFETCSCDVVCPCTASLSLGATSDYCLLVFGALGGPMEALGPMIGENLGVAASPRGSSGSSIRRGAN